MPVRTRMARLCRRVPLGSLLASVTLACGDDPVAPDPARIAFVTILPVAATLDPGDTLTLSAVPRDSLGRPVALASAVRWHSAQPAIATVDSTGLVRAVAPGQSAITATVEGVTGDAVLTVIAVLPSLRFDGVSAGGHHTCAVADERVTLCWGRNVDGQVGDGTRATTAAPSAVRIETGFILVAAGARHTCGITGAGAVLCWGWNSVGQVGAHTGEDKRLLTPVPIEAAGPFTALAAGNGHNCALRESGQAVCWGSDAAGQLGDGEGSRATPVPVLGHRFVDIVAGHAHTCAVTQDGSVLCWGWNGYGQLGVNIATSCAPYVPCATAPVAVDGLAGIIAISAGHGFSCALDSDGAAFCWGLGVNGQLGDGRTALRSAPTPVSTTVRFTAIDAGWAHACGLTAAGEVWCWGLNTDGQLGDDTRADRALPIRAVPDAPPFARASAGDTHTCAVTNAGALRCWGDRANGRLGPFAH